jgi:hypothetical protein
VAGGAPGIGLFVTYSAILPRDSYDLLCDGWLHDTKATQKLKDSIPARKGFTPQGDDLLGMLRSVLTIGADPTGQDFALPIMPTHDRRIEFSIGGMSHSERFVWGVSPETNIIQAVIQRDMAAAIDERQVGRMRQGQDQRILDALCEKYKLDKSDWKQFVPVIRRNDIAGPLPHETSASENFDTTDGAALGPQLAWTSINGTWLIKTNRARKSANNVTQEFARADVDLSSADHYAQCNQYGSSIHVGGPACRMPGTSTQTCYLTGNFSDVLYATKFVAGVQTNMVNTAVTWVSGDVYKIQASGSTITAHVNGVQKLSTTDTAITSNVRTGITQYANDTNGTLDNFLGSDLSSGTNYVELERSTRGIMRGVYTHY